MSKGIEWETVEVSSGDFFSIMPRNVLPSTANPGRCVLNEIKSNLGGGANDSPVGSNSDVAKNATTPAPKWRPFCQWKNLCTDEFAGEAVGLFGSSGYCWLGVEISQQPRTPAVGLVAFNRSVGFWQDPDPAEPVDGLSQFAGVFWAVVILLTWATLFASAFSLLWLALKLVVG